MNTELKLQKTKDLAIEEIILIENIYSILNRRDKLINVILENVQDYKKVIEAAEEIKYIDHWDGTIKQMRDHLFEHASYQTIRKIISEEKFTPIYDFQEAFLISKRVLKEFRYSAEIKKDHPKADLAKKLGAKIIL